MANKRYYMHYMLKKHGITVRASKREISATDIQYKNLSKACKKHVGKLIEIGYNVQYAIN